MNTNEVLATLDRDCILIKEAFRRLSDGTWCLGEYDRPYIEELFNRVRSAITDHIIFEEEIFFPKIRREEATLMHQEHSRLKELLSDAHFAIEKEKSLTFKILIQEIGRALQQHTEIENHVLRAFDIGQINHNNLANMQDRVFSKIV